MAKVDRTGTISTDLGKWWLVGLLGLLSIAVGVLAIVYPDITLLVLGLIVGVYLVIAGALLRGPGDPREPNRPAVGCCASWSASCPSWRD